MACEGDRLLTGERVGTQKFRPGSVETLQYTADGSVLMSAGGSDAILWDPTTGRRTKEFEAWSGKASLSADGRRVALLDFGLLESGLRVVSVDGGETVHSWKDDSSDVDALALGPAGKKLFVTNDGAVEVRNVENDDDALRLGALEDDVRSLAVAPKGALRVAAGGSKGQLRLWDVLAQSELELDTGETASVTAVSFSPDGKTLAAVDSDGVVRLYAPGGEAPEHVFTAQVPGEAAELRKVAVANDGARVIVGSWSGVYSLWKPDSSGARADLVSVLAEGLIASGAATFTPDGKTAVAAVHNGAIRFWDAETGEERAQPEAGNLADVGEAIWLSDHRAVTAAGGRAANVWDMRCGKIEATLGGHARRVVHITATRASGLIATSDEGGGVRLWDSASLKLRHEDATEGDAAGALALSDDGNWLAVARRSGLVVQDAKTFEVAWQTHRSFADNTITALAASPDGTLLLTGDTMGAVRWLDMSNGSSLASREDDYASTIRSIRFSPDGNRVATTASDKVRIYDAATGQLSATFGAPGWSVSNAAWFSDSVRLAFGDSDGHVWIVDTARARVLRAAHDETLDISSVALRSDDQGLLTGYDDSSMRVWLPTEIYPVTGSDLEVERSPAVDGVPLLSGSAKTCPRLTDDAGKGLPPCAVAKLASSDFLLDDDAGTDGRLALSADGSLLATPAGEQLHVVEVATGKVVSRMNCCEYGPASAVVFSPDTSSVVLTPPLGKTQVWTLEDGRQSHEWSFKAAALKVSPDGKTWAAVSTDGALHLVDAKGKTTHTLIPEGVGPDTTLSFSADSSLLLSTDDWSFLGWDTATGEPSMSDLDAYDLGEDFDSVWATGFDGKGNLIVNGPKRHYIAKSDGTSSSKPFPLRPEDAAEVRAYRCSDDMRVCAMVTGEGLEVGRRGGAKTLLVKGQVEHFSLQGSGARVAVSDGQAAAVWDIEAKRRLTPKPIPAARQVIIDADGTLVTAHDDALRVWKRGETAPGKPVQHALRGLQLSTPGHIAVALDEDALVRVALGSGKKTVLRSGSFWTLGVSGDGSHAALLGGDEDTTLQVVGTADGKLVWQRNAPEADAVAVSGDGSKVAVAFDETIEVYSSAKRLATMNVEHSVYQLAFSPDDTTVVAVGGGHIDAYSTTDGHEVASLADGLEANVFTFAGSRDTIITGGRDNSVRVFDLARKSQRGALQGHKAPVLDVAVGGTPPRVVTLDEHGTMFEWDIAPLLTD